MFNFFASALVFAAFSMTAPAHAFDMGVIGPQLKLGQDGPWDQRAEGRFYVLENDEAEGELKYYYLPIRRSELGKRRIEVDVEFRSTNEKANAGIIFGFEEATKNYYLFTLSPDGMVSLMRRSSDGGKVLFRGKGKEIKEGRNTLSYAENGNIVHLAVNGNSRMSSDTLELGDGGIGIAALGTGEFGFTKFRDYLAVREGSSIASLLRPDRKSRFGPKPGCALPDFGPPIPEMTVAGQTPLRLDMPAQYALVGLSLLSEGPRADGTMRLSVRQLANVPDGGVREEHICSEIESQDFIAPPMGERAGVAGVRMLPTLDLAATYPTFGAALAKNGRTVRTKPRSFAAFKAFDNDEAVLRRELGTNPMVKTDSSMWTLPGLVLIPLKEDGN